MIQRIQSIWLLLASITLICLVFIPTVSVNFEGAEYQLLADGLHKTISGTTTRVHSFLPLLISTIAVSLMCLVNIFNFRNRTNQKRFAFATIVLVIGLSFWYGQYAKQLPGGLENANYSIGICLPLIAVIFCALAIRGINNDEKLIKSADRLR